MPPTTTQALPKNTRDYQLDLFKGIGCLFMIAAHFLRRNDDPSIYNWILFIGGMAPVIFFAASGISIKFQHQKNKPLVITSYYLIAFVLSMLLNVRTRDNYLGFIPVNVVSALTITSLLYYFIRPIFSKITTLTIFLSYILFFYTNHRIDRFWWSTIIIGPPYGFNVLPWISFLFLGSFLDQHNKKQNLLLAIISLISGLTSIFYFHLPFFNNGLETHKWNMSPPYFLIGLAISSLAFIVSKLPTHPIPLINYFGQHSLLLWFANWFIFDFTQISTHIKPQPILYIASIVLIYLFMRCLQIINKICIEKHSHHRIFWLIIRSHNSYWYYSFTPSLYSIMRLYTHVCICP